MATSSLHTVVPNAQRTAAWFAVQQHRHNTNSQVNILGATVGDAEHLSIPHPSDCGRQQQLWPVIKALLKREQMTSQNKLSAEPMQPLGADGERAVTTGE